MADESEVEGRGTHGIKSHPLVELFVPDPQGEVVQRKTLFGFPDTRIPGVLRLWSLDFSSYADIPPDAVQFSQTFASGGGTMLVVDPAAKVTIGLVQPAVSQQQFLTGPITATHLPSVGAAPIVLSGTRVFPPVITLQLCFSGDWCHTWFLCGALL